ncbi:MAG: glycosyl hydrolase [Armatimonadota bacterium]
MPSNDWWSSLLWTDPSQPCYAHPLVVRTGPTGLAVDAPGRRMTANTIGVFCEFAGPDGDLLLRPTGTGIVHSTVGAATDWTVEIDLRAGSAAAAATFGHGIPVVWLSGATTGCTVAPARPARVLSAALPPHARLLAVDTARYLLVARPGTGWSLTGGAHATPSPDIAVALLPDERPETLAWFVEHAPNRVVDARVEMAYDARAAVVRSTYRLRGVVPAKPVPQALYPHQWRHRAGGAKTLGTYASNYGELRLEATTTFSTEIPFHGILPAFPQNTALRSTLARLLADETPADLPKEVRDTYWTGKDLGKWGAMRRIAEAIGRRDLAAHLGLLMKRTLERWFAPAGPEADTAVFAYDKEWTTLIGYPAGYGTDTDLNDHHFHYGYFVHAAAEIAGFDPEWVTSSRFGSMVRELIDDMACGERNHPRYPHLRCFDAYAGHSWASGNAPFASGNNQESSSEAVNAWAAMALLGMRTGDTALRDRGICLFASECAAIAEYWFDVHRTRPAAYPCPAVGMVWGGKMVHETWFSRRPEAIHAINWLPFTPASLHMGLHPEAVRRNHAALVSEVDGPFAQWKDLIWMHQALADPEPAIAAWKAEAARYEPEAGQSKAAAIEWMVFLRDHGIPDREVRLDTTSYAVLRKGKVRTYVVWNPTARPISVRATDGFRAVAKPGGPHVFKRTLP